MLGSNERSGWGCGFRLRFQAVDPAWPLPAGLCCEPARAAPARRTTRAQVPAPDWRPHARHTHTLANRGSYLDSTWRNPQEIGNQAAIFSLSLTTGNQHPTYLVNKHRYL